LPTTRDHLTGIESRLDLIETRLGTGQLVAPKPFSFWAWFWVERNWSIPVSLIVLSAFFSGAVYVAGLEIDKRIGRTISAGLAPLQKDIERIDGDTRDIREGLGLLRIQLNSQKFQSLSPIDLKKHGDELRTSQKALARLAPTSPGYWPTAFELIQLVSQANPNSNSSIENTPNGVTMKDVHSFPLGAITRSGEKIDLAGIISGVVFKNCVIQFETDIRLSDDLFVNCIFIFPKGKADVPPQNLQDIAKTLLASDIAKVTVKAS